MACEGTGRNLRRAGLRAKQGFDPPYGAYGWLYIEDLGVRTSNKAAWSGATGSDDSVCIRHLGGKTAARQLFGIGRRRVLARLPGGLVTGRRRQAYDLTRAAPDIEDASGEWLLHDRNYRSSSASADSSADSIMP